jgi:hypothetical protein
VELDGPVSPQPNLPVPAAPKLPEPAAPNSPEQLARNLRVSDAEREHVVGLLQKAVAHGLLTLDEFTERTDRALASKVRGELNSVLIDLPGLSPVNTGQTVAVPGAKPLELKTRSGNVKQAGHWVVPAEIVAECTMGNVHIDFTEATCPNHDVTLRAKCGSGNITVVVPHGWQVVLEDVTAGMGNLVNKATDAADPGLPVLHVNGRVGMGNIKIRYPRGRH